MSIKSKKLYAVIACLFVLTACTEGDEQNLSAQNTTVGSPAGASSNRSTGEGIAARPTNVNSDNVPTNVPQIIVPPSRTSLPRVGTRQGEFKNAIVSEVEVLECVGLRRI